MIQQCFGHLLCAQGDDQGVVAVRHVPSHRLLWRTRCGPSGHTRAITALSWSPDGAYLASGSLDSTVKIWEATTGRLIQTYTGHKTAIHALAWSPDGHRIASSAFQDRPRIWTPRLPTRHLLSADEGVAAFSQ